MKIHRKPIGKTIVVHNLENSHRHTMYVHTLPFNGANYNVCHVANPPNLQLAYIAAYDGL